MNPAWNATDLDLWRAPWPPSVRRKPSCPSQKTTYEETLMNKVTTFASAAVLALAAGQASAALINVTAVITGNATGAGTSATTGSGTGVYDDVADVLTLNYTQQQDTTAPGYAVGVMELTGTVVVDFGAGTAVNTPASCTSISGFDACFAAEIGIANPANSLSGDWLAFTTVDSVSGATATINYAVTPVPVPAAAWLFGSGLLGLAGVARRRKQS